MAKKVDCSFMKFAYTDADWQSYVIDPKGTLVVVDIYNKIWGPCEVLAQTFLNMFFDMSESKALRFVRAEVDQMKEPTLASFKGSALANFNFYMDGELVKEIKGPILPEIRDAIVSLAPDVVK